MGLTRREFLKRSGIFAVVLFTGSLRKLASILPEGFPFAEKIKRYPGPLKKFNEKSLHRPSSMAG